MQRLRILWDNGLEQMVTLYYPPYTAADDGEMLRSAVIGLQAYLDDLGHATPEQFQYAYRMVRRSHKTLRWPLPEAFLKHLPPPPDIVAPRGSNGSASLSGAPVVLRDTTWEEQDAMRDASWIVFQRIGIGTTDGKFSEAALFRLMRARQEKLTQIAQERQDYQRAMGRIVETSAQSTEMRQTNRTDKSEAA